MLPKLFISSILSIACAIFVLPTASQEIDPQFPLVLRSPFNESRFNESVAAFMEARKIPGLSIAVTFDDRLVYASGFGFADVAAGQMVATSDRFRLASVSKSIAAIATMYLVQLGKLSLDDRVFGRGALLGHQFGRNPYSEALRNITVQHLLEHSSGFVDEDMCGRGCDPTYLPELLDLDQWRLVGALLDRYQQSHAPGTFASYSNFGYFILGRVVEAAAGVRPYEKFVREQVLAAMNATGMRIARDKRRPHEVVYYDDEDASKPYSFHVERRDSVGAFIATPVDLARVMTSVNGLPRRANILNATTRALMFSESAVEGSHYAKGWDVETDEDGASLSAGKAGDYSGTNSYIKMDFTRNTSYAIVVNKEIANDGTFHGARDLRALMDGLLQEIDEWPDRDLFEDFGYSILSSEQPADCLA